MTYRKKNLKGNRKKLKFNSLSNSTGIIGIKCLARSSFCDHFVTSSEPHSHQNGSFRTQRASDQTRQTFTTTDFL